MASVPVPVASRSKSWVCGHSPVGTVASNPAEGMDVGLLLGALTKLRKATLINFALSSVRPYEISRLPLDAF